MTGAGCFRDVCTTSKSFFVNLNNACNINKACKSLQDVSIGGFREKESSTKSDLKISIYPNPANDIIFIDGLPDDELVIYLRDVQGNMINIIANQERIDVNDLSSGLYHLTILYNNQQEAIHKKFVKN